jgi:hypothetical protein
METFSSPRPFVPSGGYSRDRRDCLAALDLAAIDEPLVDLVSGFAELPHCFTLQCCHGHFLCAPGQDPRSLDRIPSGHRGRVRYRIAYVALCLENDRRGRALRRALARVPDVDPDFVQFGSADWFWRRWPNSYALQVAPAAHRHEDEFRLEASVAFRLQETRDLFFGRLREVLAEELRGHRSRRE